MNDYNMRRGAKIVLYTAAAFGAFGGTTLFTEAFGASGGLPRFCSMQATYAELLWAVPCIVVAYVMTLLFHGSARLFRGLGDRLGYDAAGVIGRPVIGAALPVPRAATRAWPVSSTSSSTSPNSPTTSSSSCPSK